MLKEFLYSALWFSTSHLFRRRKPLQTVLFITDYCNLNCRHCNVYNLENPTMKSIEQIEEELRYSYQLGSRFVDFEGGEPLLWRDEDLDINDLVDLAKQIGFFSVTVTTNAQFPFDHLHADSIWVSLDGIGEYHDKIRGDGAFQKLEENVANSKHKHLHANMVINSLNYKNLEETLEYVHNHPKFSSISLNFHTPYPGTETLFLPWDIRKELIDKILQFKKKGYPIMNSKSGLEYMKDNHFKKECWICNFILVDGQRLSECPGSQANLCSECGFCMAGEMKSIYNLKIDTVLAGLKLRSK